MRTSFIALVLFALMGPGQITAQTAPLPDVLYYRFNEGTGTTAVDSAIPGSGNAILQAGTGWGANLALGSGASLQLSGIGPGCTAPGLNLSGDWTIECMFDGYALPNAWSPASYTLFSDGSAQFRCDLVRNLSWNPPAWDIEITVGGYQVTSNFPTPGFALDQHLAFVYEAALGKLTCYRSGSYMFDSGPFLNNLTYSTSGLLIGGDSVTGLPLPGSIDEFRVWSVARTQAQIAAWKKTELSPFADDLGVVSLDGPTPPPTGCVSLSTSETLSFTVRNGGTNTIAAGTNFVATYSVNGGATVMETFSFSGQRHTGETASFSFTTPVDLSMPGPRVVNITASYPSDQDPSNDLLSVDLGGGATIVTTFPYTENFDSLAPVQTTTPPAGWTQDLGDAAGADADWYFRDGPTPTPYTGPGTDHTTGVAGQGHYAHVEDTLANHAQVSLLSPCFDLSGLQNPRLSFWLHSLNGQVPTSNFENFLAVDVIEPSGSITMNALGPIGHLEPVWTRQTLDLSAYAGGIVQLRFRGRSDGGGDNHDPAIDDVIVKDVAPGNGQAPQAGFAVLDLNGAASPLFGYVTSGDKGPYAAESRVGEPLAFSFGGQASQPILLLLGNLNPVAATYPGIGQMDIGGAVGSSGIPAGLQIVGNGFQPASFLDSLFVLSSVGQTNLTTVTPPLPAGVFGAFQAVIATGTGGSIRLSNAVQLTIL